MPTTPLKNALYRAAIPLCAPRPPRQPLSARSGQEIVHLAAFERLIRRHHVLGSATLLSDGDRSALLLTRSEAPAHEARENSLFRVASITKVATTALTLRLCDQGLLALDGPVAPSLPEGESCPELADVTLRQLLSHTSGLADPPGLETAMAKGTPYPQVLRGARAGAPGSAFRYSNLGFGLVGCLLEAVTNQPLEKLFQERLFEPLGMRATLAGSTLREEEILPITRIFPYRKGRDVTLTELGKKPLDQADPLRHYGYTAGSLYTDIRSLEKLFRVLMNPDDPFLSALSRAEMQKEHASYGRLSPTLSYGLGLLRIRDASMADRLILGHQGFAYGCVDGAFWEEDTSRLIIHLNGGCSEARSGRLGLCNRDLCRWAFRKEFPAWP